MSHRKDRQPKPTKLVGLGLSPGIAVGTAYRVESQSPVLYRIRISPEDVDRELNRFHQALEKSRVQLQRVKDKFEAEVGKEHSYIIDAQLLMLEDRQFLGEIEQRIKKELDSPEKALRRVSEEWLSVYDALDDPFFRERGSDFGEVVERVTANLMELDNAKAPPLPEDLILIASEIGLSTLANYPLEQVKGLILTKAGKTSHVTIIARSYQIPLVSGIEDLRSWIRTGDQVVIDGSSGIVRLGLSSSGLTRYQNQVREERRRAAILRGDCKPCLTSDQRRVYLFGNTEVGSEVKGALVLGAEGIGLFRSEYLYMKQRTAPLEEEEHFRVYKSLAETVGDRPAVIRTLDVTRSKDESVHAGEEKSTLGLRGIRFGLQHPDMFRSQVRAIIRARQFGNLRIVLPMVTSVDELLEARSLIREVEREMVTSATPIPVGVLVEVPAAVLTARSLARHADFLEVGTNDLIQYTLAASRVQEEVSYLYNPLHPAVLASLKQIQEAAAEADREVIVCGEMAAHPVHAMILIGMGFDRLSMNPFAIREVKKQLRSKSYQDLKTIVQELSRIETLSGIEEFMRVHQTEWASSPELTV
ncbi:MAG TPA: phosphoenolpyruvate--protein phosphotransferase [Acidobacteriota bacterium]|nr:phosphoenolpyruvate--protein phosphotransferase [Acidobacteriota bacterium]